MVAPIRTVVVAASYKSRHPFVTISLPNSANPYKLSITFVKILAGVTALYCYGLSRKQNVFKNIVCTLFALLLTLRLVMPLSPFKLALLTKPSLKSLWIPIFGTFMEWLMISRSSCTATLEVSGRPQYGQDSLPNRPLMIARGRDCTELFESYHCLTDVPRQMLSKFAVPSKNQKNYVSMFNWDMSSPANKFQVELRQRVREHLRKNNINTMVPNTVLFGYFAVTLFTMWMTYQYYWSGAWWASIVIPTLWWITFIQTFHDATHFAYHRNEIISNFYVYLYPYFSSPTTWDHQHVIGHHIFTNIFKKDPDLNHGMPAFRVHPRFRFRPWMKYVTAFCFLFSIPNYFTKFCSGSKCFGSGSCGSYPLFTCHLSMTLLESPLVFTTVFSPIKSSPSLAWACIFSEEPSAFSSRQEFRSLSILSGKPFGGLSAFIPFMDFSSC